MKKIIAMLLVMTLCFALCACGAEKAEEPAAEAPAAEAEPTPEPTFEFDNNSDAFDTETLSDDELAGIKVGFIFLHDENSTYDLNFLNAAKAVCDKLGVESLHKVNIDESEACYDAAMELVDEVCNIIFADSFGHEPYMIQAARECPDVEFCHATGTQAHSAGLDNYHNAFATIYEGRFLGGVAAGLKLNEMIANGDITEEEAKVGYIGAYPYAEVKSGYTSFFLGVR